MALPTHLGDGAYLDHDGFQFWLAVNDHRNRVVALEPAVFWALLTAATEHLASRGSTDSRENVATSLEEMAAEIRMGSD